jgi:hypothetical protein
MVTRPLDIYRIRSIKNLPNSSCNTCKHLIINSDELSVEKLPARYRRHFGPLVFYAYCDGTPYQTAG